MSTTSMVIDQIKQEIDRNNFSHAYLLSGPDTDIREVVENTVKELQNGKVEELDNLKCLDDGAKFGVKELRVIQNQMMLSSQSPYKTCYIENIERLSIPAINSMLKIIEEPPKGVVFFLGCKNQNNVLDTIISRCRGYEIDNNTLETDLSFSEIKQNLNSDADVIDYVQGIDDKEEGTNILNSLLSYSRKKVLDGEADYADICILTQRALDDVKANVNMKLTIEVLLLRVIRLISSINSN